MFLQKIFSNKFNLFWTTSFLIPVLLGATVKMQANEIGQFLHTKKVFLSKLKLKLYYDYRSFSEQGNCFN
jgi:hypothetical protein